MLVVVALNAARRYGITYSCKFLWDVGRTVRQVNAVKKVGGLNFDPDDPGCKSMAIESRSPKEAFFAPGNVLFSTCRNQD